MIVARCVPVADLSHHGQRIVRLSRTVLILDLVEQLRDVVALDRDEVSPNLRSAVWLKRVKSKGYATTLELGLNRGGWHRGMGPLGTCVDLAVTIPPCLRTQSDPAFQKFLCNFC